MTRMFVALWPPPEAVQALVALDRPPAEGVRWSEPVQWMVALRPLGHVVAAAVVEPLRAALEAAFDGAPAVDCVLGPVTQRLGGDWLSAPVSGLDDLAVSVFDATADIVPVTHPQPFRAYVVLARGRVPKELAGREVSASWTARSVALVADRSAPGRPRYEDLASLPLGNG